MIEAFRRVFGFDESDPRAQACLPPALALSAVMAGLPLLLLVPIDTDRAVPLAFLPAVWLGWKIVRPLTQIERWLLIGALLAIAASILHAENPARALAMTAAVMWVWGGAYVARNLANSLPAVRLVIASIATGAVLGFGLLAARAGSGHMLFPAYGSPRLFGAHQFLGGLATLGLLAFPARQRFVRALTVLAGVVTWTGLAWSGSRAAALAMGVALGLWWLRGSRAERRTLLLWAPLLAVLGLLGSLQLKDPSAQLGWTDALARTAAASDLHSLSSERSSFWRVTLSAILESPWIGHGADAYLFIHPRQNGNQPHNVLLQWALEYGAFGAVALVGLVGCGLREITRPRSIERAPFTLWAAACLAGVFIYGLFDGIFYHASAFMPAALIAGLALGSQSPVAPAEGSTDRHPTPAFFRLGLLAALLVLVLHNWLSLMLLHARNVQPDSAVARAVRLFPSATHGLINWTERWRPAQPEVAMAWIKWAQTVSTEQNSFHAHAAQIYLWNRSFRAAEAELLQCLAKGPSMERGDVITLLSRVRASAAAQEAATARRAEAAP